MSLPRIYLDQRDWIALAQQHYGRTHDDDIAGVLALVREAAATGQASFPLSAAHYMEIYHRRDPGSRQRLGDFMADISKYQTIASAPDLLDDEVHVAMCDLVGVPPSRRPQPFGRGVAHALGLADAYLTDPVLRGRAMAALGAERVFEMFERLTLRGPAQKLPYGDIAMPTREFAERQLVFERETAARLTTWGHSSDRAHRLVLAQETRDVLDAVNGCAADLGVDPHELLGSRDSLTNLMMSLPAKGAITRLRMSAHEDQAFAWHIGDLNDVTALGTAAAYCDIVVAEKKWGSILRRHAKHLHATVTSNLLDLPELLVNLSSASAG